MVETKSGKDKLHDTVKITYPKRYTSYKTAIHSEKSTNCTDSLQLSQQPGIRQKQQMPQKNQGKTRAGNGDLHIN